MTTPQPKDASAKTPDIESIERYLRQEAANKAVADADRYGWTEVREGMFLDTAERLKATGQRAEGAPYFLSTNDSEPPVPIQGASDERLRGAVDVGRELTRAARNLDIQDAQAKQGRGRTM